MKAHASADEMFRSKSLAISCIGRVRRMFIPPPIGAARPRNFDVVRSLDDFQRELADLSQCAFQLRPGIAPSARTWRNHGQRWRMDFRTAGAPSDDEADQQAERVDEDIALASHDLLAGVKTAYSTAFGGLNRLAVKSATLGDASRPSLPRRHHGAGLPD